MGQVTVGIDELRAAVSRVYDNTGLLPEEKEVLIDNLIDAELRGVASHGIIRTIPYYNRMRQGGIRPAAPLTKVKDHHAISVYDANHGLGQWMAYQAMQSTVHKARSYGIGAVSVRNSQHFGTAGYYAKLAADEDMIGLVFTNASARLAPWGGKEPLFGNNPWAVAVPTPQKEIPFVLDIANSVTAAGKIRGALKRGEAIPSGWAMDANGELTTDPAEALKGILLPFGEHKGYGITFAVSILSSLLSAGRSDTEVTSVDQVEVPQGVSHFFAAIHIDAFQPIEAFKEQMGTLISQIHNGEKFANRDRLYYPGERGYSLKQRALRSGSAKVDQNVWEEISGFVKV